VLIPEAVLEKMKQCSLYLSVAVCCLFLYIWLTNFEVMGFISCS